MHRNQYCTDPTTGLRLWACETCNISVLLDSQQRHLASELHTKNTRALALRQEGTSKVEGDTTPEHEGGVRLEPLGLTAGATIPTIHADEAWERDSEDKCQLLISEQLPRTLATNAMAFTAPEKNEILGRNSGDDTPLRASNQWLALPTNATTPTLQNDNEAIEPGPEADMHSWTVERWPALSADTTPPHGDKIAGQETTADMQPWSMIQWQSMALDTMTPAAPQENEAEQESRLYVNPWVTEQCESLITSALMTTSPQESESAGEATEDLQPWTCTTCDITILAKNRTSHEGGKRHRQKAAELAESPKLVADSEYPTTSDVEKWDCKICNITIAARYQGAHEAGKRHILKSNRLPWTCTLCNITITIGRRQSHEVGQQHRGNLSQENSYRARAASLARSESIVKPNTSAGGTWTCIVCNVIVNADSRARHEAETSHRRAVSKPFECKICSVNVAPSTLALHRAGKMHQANLKALDDVRRVVISKPPAPTPSAPSPTNIWTCMICDVKLHKNIRAAHEAGKAHRAIVQAIEQARRAVKEKAPAPVSTAPSPSRTWTCTICDIKMHPNTRAAHEACKSHKDALKSLEGIRRAATAVSPAPTFGATSPATIWTCTICNVRLHVNIQGSHEAGKKHRANVEALAGVQETVTVPPCIEPETWTCTACEITVPSADRDSHEESIDHTIITITSGLPRKTTGSSHVLPLTTVTLPRTTSSTCNTTTTAGSVASDEPEDSRPPWVCEVCNITMSAGAQWSHESGKRHAKALADKKAARASLLRTPSTQSIATLDSRDPNHQLTWFPHEPWTCTVCNVTIPALSKEPHEASKEHLELIGSVYKISGVILPPGLRKEHQAGGRHRARVTRPTVEYIRGHATAPGVGRGDDSTSARPRSE